MDQDSFVDDMTTLLHHLLANTVDAAMPNITFGTRKTKDDVEYNDVRTFLLPTFVELGFVKDLSNMHDPEGYVFTEITMSIREAISSARAYLDDVESRLVHHGDG